MDLHPDLYLILAGFVFGIVTGALPILVYLLVARFSKMHADDRERLKNCEGTGKYPKKR